MQPGCARLQVKVNVAYAALHAMTRLQE